MLQSSSSSSCSVGVEWSGVRRMDGWTKDDDDWGNKLAPMGFTLG